MRVDPRYQRIRGLVIFWNPVTGASTSRDCRNNALVIFWNPVDL